MPNPALPVGAINGSRFKLSGNLSWKQPDNTVIHITPADKVEVRIDGSGTWLDVEYAGSSIDRKIQTAVAEIQDDARRAAIIFG